jgi:hypothetical protein
MNDTAPVIIVGRALPAHLRQLPARFGIPVHPAGGRRPAGRRARTDLVEGFRLDRGFQIFLTAYPRRNGCSITRRWT